MLRNNGRYNFRGLFSQGGYGLDNLLTEDNFNIVQEDGSFILI